MITDPQCTLCEDFDIGALGSGATGLVQSGGTDAIIDLTVAGRGTGFPLEVFAVVTEDFAGLSALNLKLETDDDTSFAASNVVLASVDRLTAALVEGYRIPLGTVLSEEMLQYLSVRYTCTGDPTDGMLSIFIVASAQTNA